MKDIFKILQEEKNRILEMHESKTKSHYLNIISEQTFEVPSYTTQKWNQFSKETEPAADVSVGFAAGVKFETTKDSKIVTAKNVKVMVRNVEGWVPSNVTSQRVSFYCQKGKFYFQGDQTGYVSSQLSSVLVKNVCGKLNYQTTTASAGAKFTQSQDSSFTAENGGYANGPKKGTTWTWDGKKATAPGINGGTVVFKCNPSKFGFNFEFEGMMFKDNGSLKNALVKRFCKVADNTQQPGTQTPVVEPPSAQNPRAGVKNPTSGNQLTNINKQIQQLLGNQAPTGKITDTDIDAILSKLV
jgi:hypothetical protein